MDAANAQLAKQEDGEEELYLSYKLGSLTYQGYKYRCESKGFDPRPEIVQERGLKKGFGGRSGLGMRLGMGLQQPVSGARRPRAEIEDGRDSDEEEEGDDDDSDGSDEESDGSSNEDEDGSRDGEGLDGGVASASSRLSDMSISRTRRHKKPRLAPPSSGDGGSGGSAKNTHVLSQDLDASSVEGKLSAVASPADLRSCGNDAQLTSALLRQPASQSPSLQSPPPGQPVVDVSLSSESSPGIILPKRLQQGAWARGADASGATGSSSDAIDTSNSASSSSSDSSGSGSSGTSTSSSSGSTTSSSSGSTTSSSSGSTSSGSTSTSESESSTSSTSDGSDSSLRSDGKGRRAAAQGAVKAVKAGERMDVRRCFDREAVESGSDASNAGDDDVPDKYELDSSAEKVVVNPNAASQLRARASAEAALAAKDKREREAKRRAAGKQPSRLQQLLEGIGSQEDFEAGEGANTDASRSSAFSTDSLVDLSSQPLHGASNAKKACALPRARPLTDAELGEAYAEIGDVAELWAIALQMRAEAGDGGGAATSNNSSSSSSSNGAGGSTSGDAFDSREAERAVLEARAALARRKATAAREHPQRPDGAAEGEDYYDWLIEQRASGEGDLLRADHPVLSRERAGAKLYGVRGLNSNQVPEEWGYDAVTRMHAGELEDQERVRAELALRTHRGGAAASRPMKVDGEDWLQSEAKRQHLTAMAGPTPPRLANACGSLLSSGGIEGSLAVTSVFKGSHFAVAVVDKEAERRANEAAAAAAAAASSAAAANRKRAEASTGRAGIAGASAWKGLEKAAAAAAAAAAAQVGASGADSRGATGSKSRR